ncbi:MAG: M56 family metallopeptidase [Planctomycetota bacterium]
MTAAPSTWIDAAGLVLLHSLWMLTALAALAAFGFARLADAPARRRHDFGLLILFAMVAAPLIAFGVTLGLETQETANSVTTTIAPSLTTPPAATTLNESVSPTVTAPATVPAGRTWTSWVVLAWSLGVAFGSLRLTLGWLGTRQLKRRGVTPCAAFSAEHLERLHARLGLRQLTPILVSTRAATACAAGWLRPVVLLPVAVVRDLTPPQLEAIVLHELAHLRRRDPWWNALQCVAETLLFFHPAAWWLSANIRDERERACDDAAVGITGDAAGYARALVATAETACERDRHDGSAWPSLLRAPWAPAATGRGARSLTARVLRLVDGFEANQRHRNGRRASTGLAAAALFGGALMLVAACGGPAFETTARRDLGPRIIDIDAQALLSGDRDSDIVVLPGDAIHIAAPPSGFIYLAGEVRRPGTYSISGAGRLTVKQAYTSAGGRPADSTEIAANGVVVEVVRRLGTPPDHDGLVYRQRVRHLFDGTAPDLYLAAEDLLTFSRLEGAIDAVPVEPAATPPAAQRILPYPTRPSWDPFDGAETYDPRSEDHVTPVEPVGDGATFEVIRRDGNGQTTIDSIELPPDRGGVRLLHALNLAGGFPDQTETFYIVRGEPTR